MRKKEAFNYFDVLVLAIRYSHQTAQRLIDLLEDYQDVERKAREIHDLEHAADHECHRLFDALNVAFITPIDREDIYALIKSIDDITDLVEDVANRFDMFHIARIRPEALQIARLIEKATGMLVELLTNFKPSRKTANGSMSWSWRSTRSRRTATVLQEQHQEAVPGTGRRIGDHQVEGCA
jgi:uncharacterized protein Yka (UPF0111/DUF47 family)